MARSANSSKEVRDRKVAAGLCDYGGCREGIVPGRRKCAKHLGMVAAWARTRTKRAVEAGMCHRCPSTDMQPVEPGKRLCARCLAAASERNMASYYRDRERHAAEARDCYRRAKEAGKCAAWCGNDAAPGRVLCNACIDKRANAYAKGAASNTRPPTEEDQA